MVINYLHELPKISNALVGRGVMAPEQQQNNEIKRAGDETRKKLGQNNSAKKNTLE